MARSNGPSRCADPSADTPGATAPAAGEAVAGAGQALGFEAALEELESIVGQMEGGDLTLEQSLAAYRRGTQLLQLCQGVLKDAQQQVKVLEEGLLRDFGGGEQPD
jgi:exodeoxyribonuclease VII small subunit